MVSEDSNEAQAAENQQKKQSNDATYEEGQIMHSEASPTKMLNTVNND